ncbi:MAG TPA: hypothetical protein VFE32_06500 [Puia sp.]|jgi:hypothetical protein|nr:hypothetical protein [Puia sp.]
MKKLFYKLISVIAPVGVLVVLVNYFIDPANIFSGTAYVAGISDILVKGHNVDNVSNYDERALQEQMIRKLPYRPDVVVLGSSRVMELGSTFFPGKKVLNCGVSHANINDLIAITGLLDSTNKLPDEMVINVDPHLICLGGTMEWQTLMPYHKYLMGKWHIRADAGQRSLLLEKLGTLISFEYFEKSLTFLSQHRSKRFLDVGTGKPALYGRYSDGTICYPAFYAVPDTLKVAADARVVGGREIVNPDPDKADLLSKLVDYLKSRKVKVVLVMLPYHHEYYQAMNHRFGNVFSSYDTLYRQFAQAKAIPIYGGFDAIGLGIPLDEFYDSWHCSREAIKKVYNQN